MASIPLLSAAPPGTRAVMVYGSSMSTLSRENPSPSPPLSPRTIVTLRVSFELGCSDVGSFGTGKSSPVRNVDDGTDPAGDLGGVRIRGGGGGGTNLFLFSLA